ncbi:hypothetical protein BGZ96_003144 [Linnemannia gamsii]|uniref:FAD/NAD(P)-binding domain-containing protein n=1 Tax=Linnemannia gamsii TaxID=64522 RepID=A0ABQ7JK11_9FUNG|nr:hypothetical protein BGZ96_003144 [Linnemannia gamsii]
MCNEQLEVQFGAIGYIISRPKIYKLLACQVPKERIHFGKKVLSMENGGNGVLISFSDGTVAEGISFAARQNLYAKLLKDKKLAPSDALPLPFTTVCLVGQTRVLTQDEFPDIALEESRFRNHVGEKKPYAVMEYVHDRTGDCVLDMHSVSYGGNKQRNDAFRNSGWGPEAAQTMATQVRDFPVVSGGDKKLTLGDLIDWTPKEFMSKAMQEEKVFKTWYGCRTVLIGDACHKFNLAGGVGAANAMHDAIVLANRINGLPFHPTAQEMEDVFQEYKDESHDLVKAAFNASKVHRTMAGQHIPEWVFHRIQVQATSCHPQAAFLPLVEDKGTYKPLGQPSLSVKSPIENEYEVSSIAQAV